MKHQIIGALLAASTALTPVLAKAEVTIEWWHAMGGELGELLEAIAEDFNADQSEVRVVPSFRGTYTETMTGAIAAFRAGEQPHIVQVFEVGTGTMMAAEGAVYPIYELMADFDVPFDPQAYLPAVVGYYTDPNDLRRGRAGPGNAARDLGRHGSSLGGDHAIGRGPLRLHDVLAKLGHARELQRLAQHPAGDQWQRLWWL